MAEKPNQMTQELTEAVAEAINCYESTTQAAAHGLEGMYARAYGLPGMIALTMPDGSQRKLRLTLEDMPMYTVQSL